MSGADAAGPPGVGRALERFRRAYGRHRAREGRGPMSLADLLALPFLEEGRFAAEWAIRSRSFLAFLERVVKPLERRRGGPLRVLDLGAGNGWLCFRLAERGHAPMALDLRIDTVDGLGAAGAYSEHVPRMFGRVSASFESLPLVDSAVDLAVFNASIHYATNLERVLTETVRAVAPGGRLAILDSPFYPNEDAGDAMVAEKRRSASTVFGDLADDLTTLPFVEYLTPARLAGASRAAGLRWRKERVRYPLAYELRPVRARLAGRRPPSRFDVWWTEVP